MSVACLDLHTIVCVGAIQVGIDNYSVEGIVGFFQISTYLDEVLNKKRYLNQKICFKEGNEKHW